MKYLLLANCMICTVFGVLPGVWGADVEPREAVDMGRRALERRSHMPWYDDQADALRQLEVAPEEDDASRLSRWATNDTPRRPATRRDWSLLWLILRGLTWTFLALLVGAIIWGLIWAAMRLSRRDEAPRTVVSEVHTPAARLEDLPLPVAPDLTDLLAAARACRAAGDLGTAIVYLFAHQLMELDKHHLIQVTQGKTNRQYLGELRTHPHLVDLVRPCMLACEEVYFGHHSLSPQRFDTCWENLDRFHQQLELLAT